MSKYYPQLIIPFDLEVISKSLPPIPTINEPRKPTLVEPKIPAKPTEPTSFSQAWGCGLLILGVFTLVIYGGRNSDTMSKIIRELTGAFPFNLIFLAAPFIAIYMIYSYHKNSDSQKAEYERKLKIYEQEKKKYDGDIIHYKVQYEQDLFDYEQDLYPKYLADKKKIEEDKEIVLSAESTIRFRREKVAEYFKRTQQPTEISNPYLTGVTEENFFKFLQTKSDKYFKEYSIIYGDTTERFYVPDIVYYDSEIGILIDIEIDEPYLGSDGTPIHYVGHDDKRNSFFTENGWIVLRFAEEQVVKYPAGCYEFIEVVIQSILTGQFSLIQNSLRQISQWTKDEAHKMAFSRKRNSYLAKNLVERMTQERVIEAVDNDNDVAQDDLPF